MRVYTNPNHKYHKKTKNREEEGGGIVEQPHRQEPPKFLSASRVVEDKGTVKFLNSYQRSNQSWKRWQREDNLKNETTDESGYAVPSMNKVQIYQPLLKK